MYLLHWWIPFPSLYITSLCSPNILYINESVMRLLLYSCFLIQNHIDLINILLTWSRQRPTYSLRIHFPRIKFHKSDILGSKRIACNQFSNLAIDISTQHKASSRAISVSIQLYWNWIKEFSSMLTSNCVWNHSTKRNIPLNLSLISAYWYGVIRVIMAIKVSLMEWLHDCECGLWVIRQWLSIIARTCSYV